MASISRWSVLMRGGFLRGTADCFYVYTHVQRSPLTVCRNIWGWAAVAVGRLRSLYIQIQELHLKKDKEEKRSQFFSYFISFQSRPLLFIFYYLYTATIEGALTEVALSKKGNCALFMHVEQYQYYSGGWNSTLDKNCKNYFAIFFIVDFFFAVTNKKSIC